MVTVELDSLLGHPGGLAGELEGGIGPWPPRPVAGWPVTGP
jgi:hypothetical protein